MAISTDVTFRGLPHSDILEADIRNWVAWLAGLCDGVLRCRVLVEVPHRHRASGRLFHVRIEVAVRGGSPIIVTHQPSMHSTLKDIEVPAHHKDTDAASMDRDVYRAVHEAFEAARHQVQHLARDQRRSATIDGAAPMIEPTS